MHCKTPRSLAFPLSVLLFGCACSSPARASAACGGQEGEAKEEAPKWDVDAPPGPSHEVALDVTRGTWMSVDVSPDGRELVFDLLGDLYVLPIDGGEALALTHGIAWDMQPRYSPDGEWIAFTSDRAGGDNVWIIRRDGSDARQVTKETFRLVNDPVWSPDGATIAVRKHFTDFRSLGTGEIWLYHESGGTGLRMTEKPNEQKDVGEPAFSPDGRYVYYSHDSTPGETFEYNKNPHAGIYAIERLDRESGEIERIAGGIGGAVRPTPSPDGEQLAFVRRVRTKTVLWVADLESGAERPLWDGLDRDLQETWAIHGVYPRMAWTPDGTAIVVWAQGGLWRVDATTGEAREIPFHVVDERTVTEALHQPLDVAPEEFDVKMVRWAEVSPDGELVVFQALGKLWIRDLEGGDPRRLTDDEQRFEYYPAWSRDGQEVVYVAWDDEELASIRVVPREGGASRVVNTQPGHYVQPALTPDGNAVVYARVGGEGLTSPLWSREHGIWMQPLDGGEPVRLTRSGVRPHFADDPNRVYYMDWEDEDKRVLKSIRLDDRKEQVHLRSEAAGEFRVSPDGRWIGFVERFRAYVAPFPPTGRTVEIGPKNEAMPQVRLSEGSADYLRFSGDSSRLYWTMGPRLYERDLASSFDFLEGGGPAPETPGEGRLLGFAQPTAVPEGKVAFVGGRVVPITGDTVIEDGVVVVERDRITEVGARGEVAVPPDALVIDIAGKTLLPGFVDVHAHGPQGEHGMQPQQNWLHFATLAFGVTTVHDPSNDTQDVFASSELARAGMITAPRIFSTGTILYGARGSYKAEIESLDDARFHLERMKAVGAFSVKSYNQPRRDQRQEVIAAARELGMEVVPEGGSLFQHNMTMVVDGHTGIEHALPLGAVYDDVLTLWGHTGVGYTPTLVVAYGGIWGENYWYEHTDVADHERLLRFVPRTAIDRVAVRGMHVRDGDWNHIRVARVAKQLFDAGVRVNLGAHGQREGLGAHWELWMLAQGGMTPLEALRCATLDGAHYIGAEDQLGSIEPGKLADLIVIDGNPLEDIRVSENVAYTMVGGRLYDAATMNELGSTPRERAPFYWER